MACAGVDGTPGGWAVVISDLNRTSVQKVAALSDLFDSRSDLKIVAVDVPIGLLEHYEKGGRACDRMARKFLGKGRYSRYQEGGIEALEDGKPRPQRVWNKIPDAIGTAIVNLALEEPDLSPRELAVNFTDTKGSFVSEATVYRLLKDHGLITSPAFILMKAADRFANPTTAPNQLWQTDFTYLKVIGWGWFYLSTVLDDFSRQHRRVRRVLQQLSIPREPGQPDAG